MVLGHYLRLLPRHLQAKFYLFIRELTRGWSFLQQIVFTESNTVKKERQLVQNKERNENRIIIVARFYRVSY